MSLAWVELGSTVRVQCGHLPISYIQLFPQRLSHTGVTRQCRLVLWVVIVWCFFPEVNSVSGGKSINKVFVLFPPVMIKCLQLPCLQECGKTTILLYCGNAIKLGGGVEVEVVITTIMDKRFGSNSHLLALVHTRQTRMQFYQPNLSPTPLTNVENQYLFNLSIALGGGAEPQRVFKLLKG